MKRVLLLAVVLLAGCGSDSGNQASGDGATGGGSVELAATEFAFDPSTVKVDGAGTTTFTLVNDGKFPHALEIEGNGVEEKTDQIDGGKTTTLTVDLKAGEYEFYCPVSDHRSRGMEGTLVVGGAAGGVGTTTEETKTENSGYGYGG
jgi:iron uptake system component EfeO